MASNKKSVLLYCDIIHTVEELSDVDAGKLFKHYLRYINDKNPDPPSKLIKIVFEPIKQGLKRDLKKWEKTSEKNSANAKKRWSQTMPNNATASDRMPTDAIYADSDKDSDSVIDKDMKGKSHAEIFAESTVWKESLCMKHKIKADTLPGYFSEFFIHLTTQRKDTISLKEKQSYFDNWLGKKVINKPAETTQYPYQKYK